MIRVLTGARVFVVVILILLSSHLGKRLLIACQPYPQLWFTAHFEIDVEKVPKGIQIDALNTSVCASRDAVLLTTSKDSYEPGALAIVNHTESPIYLLEEHVYQDVIQRQRTKQTEGIDWAVIVAERMQELGLEEMAQEIPVSPQSCFQIAPDGIGGIKNRNRWDFYRPDDIDVPKTQSAILVLIHERQAVRMTVTLNYTLADFIDRLCPGNDSPARRQPTEPGSLAAPLNTLCPTRIFIPAIVLAVGLVAAGVRVIVNKT